jgi:hypothetical protein
MKKTVLLITVILTSATLSFRAQENEENASRDARKKVVPGVKIGFDKSRVYNTSGEAFVAGPRTGYAVGGYLAIPLGRLLGFQPEIMLQEKGFKGSGRTSEGVTYSIARRTTNVDIPLEFMFKPFRWLTFLLGPQYSYVLQQDDVVNYSGNSIQTQQDLGPTNLRKNLFGTIGGVDLNFKHVVLSYRSGWDVSSNNGDGTSSSPSYKNSWWQATIGYRFY